jgi:4-hydroxybenzoate polyprenyltransferase
VTSRTALLRSLRPHQWAKNLLVFLPALAAHTLWFPTQLVATAITFVAFSLCASAIYIINDMIDVDADRQHPQKRRRPFASGELNLVKGRIVAGVLLVSALSLSLLYLSWVVVIVLLTYMAATTAYSLILKRHPIIDVFTLTGLYVLRMVAGAVAADSPLSSWFLGFALFFFLSLAFVKRYTELLTATGWVAGRGYSPDDAQWIHAIGVSAGYMAVVVLALYLNSPEITVLYTRPQALWILCPIMLFWITRMWFRASRQLIHDDPVVEALKDWMSYVTVGITGAAMLVAI